MIQASNFTSQMTPTHLTLQTNWTIAYEVSRMNNVPAHLCSWYIYIYVLLSLPRICSLPASRNLFFRTQIRNHFPQEVCPKSFLWVLCPPEWSTALFFYAYHALLTACLIFASPPRLWHPWKKKQWRLHSFFSFINQNEGFLYSSE